MIELILILSAMFGFNGEAASAGNYPLGDFGIRGFSGYTLAASPEDTPAEAFVAEREPVAASRSEPRREPAENNPTPAPPDNLNEAPEPVSEPVAATPAPVGGVMGIAASYVGYPYVLYGTPPATFDCSGYVWWVYKQAGIDIPMTVNGQKGAVTPVSNPQPGDLIFYNDFHHVGIYAGNGMTYEALNPSSGVRYGPLVNTNVWYGRIG